MTAAGAAAAGAAAAGPAAANGARAVATRAAAARAAMGGTIRPRFVRMIPLNMLPSLLVEPGTTILSETYSVHGRPGWLPVRLLRSVDGSWEVDRAGQTGQDGALPVFRARTYTP